MTLHQIYDILKHLPSMADNEQEAAFEVLCEHGVSRERALDPCTLIHFSQDPVETCRVLIKPYADRVDYLVEKSPLNSFDEIMELQGRINEIMAHLHRAMRTRGASHD